MSALFVSLALLLSNASEEICLFTLDCDDCNLRPLFAIAPYKIDFFGRILNDPNSGSYRICRTYVVLEWAKIDHKQFLPAALRDVLHKNPNVRRKAVQYIGIAGSGSETGLLMMMLADPKPEVVVASWTALRKIGDDRTVVALNLWLKYNPEPKDHPKDKNSMQKVLTKVRDDIQIRLDAAKKAPPAEPTPKK